MTVQGAEITLGVDVSKHTLDIYEWAEGRSWQVANDAESIAKFLKTLAVPMQIAIEPTSSYHLKFVEKAHALGSAIYLVNTRQLAHYRKAVGERNKTDPTDAWLLARYLDRERSELQQFHLPDKAAQQLWSLIKRRGALVGMQQQLRQGVAPVISVKSADRALQQVIRRIDARVNKLIRKLGWSADYQRCLTMPGIGPVNAAALVAAYHRGAFSGADAFIAYLGLDVRIRESGRFKGKRKLTKYGESELRRLLWCAAQPACSYAPFDQYRTKQLDKGLSKIAAKVILARKLARIAFALLRDQTTFKKQAPEPCLVP